MILKKEVLTGKENKASVVMSCHVMSCHGYHNAYLTAVRKLTAPLGYGIPKSNMSYGNNYPLLYLGYFFYSFLEWVF